ncbi:SEL1-like repeat protein [Helicobacter baculiformis]|uniref:SEL1-like repeat protein n=1 Tax=Helicobacter baculiformis TaxID=427351 RepID=A0ABV7ZM51_9HELI|nr:SEL1-like repeat protein [Helicobacter baculiformis]
MDNKPANLSDDALLALFNRYNQSAQLTPHQVRAYLNAFEHFKRIALGEADFGYEFYALGKAYEEGLGVSQDTLKAKALYTEAIKHYQVYEGNDEKHLEAIRVLEKWL